MRRDVVAGLGFRGEADAEAIVALVRRALAAAAVPEARLAVLATADDRAGAPALRAAAAAFGLAPSGLSSEALRAVDARVPTRSPRIEASRGVGSLAEAAALAAAGPGARLILPRLAEASVTCALALVRETA